MKRLPVFLATLLALCLFAIPATAATDDFTVTVIIPALNYFLVTDGNDSVSIVAGDLTAGYRNETLTSDIAIYDNGTWTATLTSDSDPSGYLLWIDDTDTGQTTGNYTALTTTPTAMSSFTNYGAAGQHDYTNITMLITGLDWTDKDASPGTTYVATVTYTPST